MNKLGVPVAIEDIEINMEGRPLSDTEVKLFENNYRNYIKDSEKTKDVFEETIEEIANLLSVNQTNFDKVQKQKWFSRSWNTITGKNKKLEKQSLLNLQKVQKGALFFLQNLAERNQETMESVIFAIKRIEDMQLESMKLKGYLTNIVIKYNSRLKKIESRLDDHDFAIKQLNKSKSNISLILFAVLFFIAAILLFILTEKIETKWVLSSILFIISIFMIYSGKNNQKDLNDKIEIGNETDSLTEIQKENLELRSQLNENLINVYPKIILTNDFFDSPFEDFFKTVNEIAKYYGSISSDMEKENFSEVIRKIIELEIVNSHTINTMIQKNLSYFIELNSEFNQKIINNYLPESIGLDVLISLDIKDYNKFIKDLEETFNPYSYKLEDVNNLGNELFNNYNQFNDLFMESSLKTFTKDFIEGLTFGLIGDGEAEENYVNSFLEKIDDYYNELGNLTNIIENSVIPMQTRIYYDLLEEVINKIQILWDEFDEKNVSLKELLKEFEEIIDA